jgi:predicted acetyltransferase
MGVGAFVKALLCACLHESNVWQPAVMPVSIRAITADESDRYRESLMNVFGGDVEDDPTGPQRFRALLPPGQAWAAFDGTQIVATAGSYDLTLRLPGLGAAIPMAGLTMVTVKPTHRRRGILRQLMDLYFDNARQRGIALMGLWASEASIYSRFGFGVAAQHQVLTIADAHRLHVMSSWPVDDLTWLDESEARVALPKIYAEIIAPRPGAIDRSEDWWRERRFLEAPFVRGGASKRRHVVARRNGRDVGYVGYRQRGRFSDGEATGKAEIIELMGIDGQAESSLWRFMLGLDLFPGVSWSNAPVDCILPLMVDDPRRIKRSPTDNVWLRLDNVVQCLQSRHYAADGALDLVVDGEPYRMRICDGVAAVDMVAIASLADPITLDRVALASIYLGATPCSHFATAGRLQGSSAALAHADQLFAWPVAPWCAEVF